MPRHAAAGDTASAASSRAELSVNALSRGTRTGIGTGTERRHGSSAAARRTRLRMTRDDADRICINRQAAHCPLWRAQVMRLSRVSMAFLLLVRTRVRSSTRLTTQELRQGRPAIPRRPSAWERGGYGWVVSP